MRSISQIIVAILLVGAAMVAGTMLSYIVTNMISTYKPSEVMVARVGDIDIELGEVTSSYYMFRVTVKLANLGTLPLSVTGGDIVVLVKGPTGRAIIKRCFITEPVSINPGEIGEVTGDCYLSKSTEIQDLFGSQTPPADKIKSSITFLYLHIYINYGGGIGTPLLSRPGMCYLT